MSTSVVPRNEWHEFLQSLTARHQGWTVSIETHDLETGETVASRFARLESVELDLEDRKNPRINVNVRDGLKEIKRILFRPSNVMFRISLDGIEEAVRVVSVNTVTTIRFRVAASPALLDGAA